MTTLAGNPGRPPARNLIRHGHEALAAFIFQRIQVSRGTRTVAVDDAGNMVIYAPNDKRMNRKPVEWLVGNYGARAKIEDIEDDLICRARELSGSAIDPRWNS